MDLRAILLPCVLFALCITGSKQQTAEIEAIYTVSDALNTFALRFLAETVKLAESVKNVALSPYTAWTLLAIISEGARGNTARELEMALTVPPVGAKEAFRKNYKSLSKYLTQPTPGIQMEITNAIFTTAEYLLNQTFQTISQSFYGVDVMAIDFNNTPRAVEIINSYISKATKNRISNFVTKDDLTDAEIFMSSALYFKGQWTVPFNKSATELDSFYDEAGNKVTDVMMMYQKGSFPYARIEHLKAVAIELGYGANGKMSMFVILPWKQQTLATVLELIAVSPISKLIEILADAEQQFIDEDIEVFLPRFKVNTDVNLEQVLNRMGIHEIFDMNTADLLGICPQYLYVSQMIQKAEIEVNEQGTVATAASGATFGYKSTPPRFYANRPFAFVIVDKQTRSIVFTGIVRHPR